MSKNPSHSERETRLNAIVSKALEDFKQSNESAHNLLIEKASSGLFLEKLTGKGLEELSTELLETISEEETKNENS